MWRWWDCHLCRENCENGNEEEKGRSDDGYEETMIVVTFTFTFIPYLTYFHTGFLEWIYSILQRGKENALVDTVLLLSFFFKKWKCFQTFIFLFIQFVKWESHLISSHSNPSQVLKAIAVHWLQCDVSTDR